MDAWRVAAKSTDAWLPVRLVDSTDLVTGETGKTATDVTIKVSGEGSSGWTTVTISAGDWSEIGDGNYWLRIGASEFASLGRYFVRVECSGCWAYTAVVEVGLDLSGVDVSDKANLYAQLRRVHALVGGTVIEHDPSSPATRTYRDEGDAADLLTRTQTVAIDNSSRIAAS